jgi:DNA-binding XRE family transcriptional regulator
MEITNESHGIAFAALIGSSTYTKSGLARELGITPQSIYNWEVRGVPAKNSFQVARILGCSPSDISEVDEKSSFAEISPFNERLSVVKCYKESGGIDGDMVLDSGCFPGINSPAAVIVESLAMSPRYRSGDRLIFDQSRHPTPGDTVVVREPSGRLLVRAYKELDTDGNYQLTALSDDWPTITSNESDGSYELLGPALGLIRGF